jgi:hypothetical protein
MINEFKLFIKDLSRVNLFDVIQKPLAKLDNKIAI